MWSAKSKNLTADQTKSDVGRGTKHIKMVYIDFFLNLINSKCILRLSSKIVYEFQYRVHLMFLEKYLQLATDLKLP